MNELYGDEEVKRRARVKARFINSGMMATLLGAIISDALDDGRVVSGVGGQYNFVSQAFALNDAELSSPSNRSANPVGRQFPTFDGPMVTKRFRGICVTSLPLVGEALRQELIGSLLAIDTPLAGMVIPSEFRRIDLVSGEAGPLASTLGAARDRGRWWINNDRLCVKWFRWFEAQTRCITVEHDGAKIF